MNFSSDSVAGRYRAIFTADAGRENKLSLPFHARPGEISIAGLFADDDLRAATREAAIEDGADLSCAAAERAGHGHSLGGEFHHTCGTQRILIHRALIGDVGLPASAAEAAVSGHARKRATDLADIDFQRKIHGDAQHFAVRRADFFVPDFRPRDRNCLAFQCVGRRVRRRQTGKCRQSGNIEYDFGV
jgi:hypothetical protein